MTSENQILISYQREVVPFIFLGNVTVIQNKVRVWFFFFFLSRVAYHLSIFRNWGDSKGYSIENLVHVSKVWNSCFLMDFFVKICFFFQRICSNWITTIDLWQGMGMHVALRADVARSSACRTASWTGVDMDAWNTGPYIPENNRNVWR